MLIVGCCAGTNKAGPSTTVTPAANVSYKASDNPVPLGDRLLGLSVTLPMDNDFNKWFREARSSGVNVVEVPILWNEMEPAKGQYKDPYNVLMMSRTFYPKQNMKIALTLGPLDTNNNCMPADLKGKPFNDPEVIARYENATDYEFSQLQGVDIQSISIGNEVDVYLGNDEQKWQQYQAFYSEVGRYLKSRHPGLKIGVKSTFAGLTKHNVDQVRSINSESDLVLVTYYPLNDDFTVRGPASPLEDFAKVVALYPNKEIDFRESGYPSSPLLGSSEEKQAEFVKQTFVAWDEQKDHVKLVIFMWLHDASPFQIDTWGRYYGFTDSKFLAYLGTLGFRTYDGKDKIAWTTFQDQAKARKQP